jgi:hypothetical protein
MVKVSLVQFRITQKSLGVLALQDGGDLVDLVASKASCSFKLAALVLGEFHCATSNLRASILTLSWYWRLVRHLMHW